MNPSKLVSAFRPAGIFAALFFTLTTSTASAATFIWSGASGTDTNWSNGNNWFGSAAPASADDVKFFNAGTNGVVGTPNNLVDGGFGGTIGSLQFGQTNGTHTVAIASGVTLNITGPGGLFVGTTTDPGVATTNWATITGAGGTLNLSNPSASLNLSQGQSAANNSRANLDMSGLDKFNANIYNMGLWSLNHFFGGVAQRTSGFLFLAKTNVVTLGSVNTLANYMSNYGLTNSLEVVYASAANNGALISFVYLGISNIFNVDSIGFGKSKASANSAPTMLFNPAFTNLNPVAVFRGATGGNSRVTWWSLGDMADNGSTAQIAIGTNDFRNGAVDARIETLALGRDTTAAQRGGANNLGVLNFNQGTVDVNTLLAGFQSLNSTNTVPCVGQVIVSGAAATLVVNSNLYLGFTTTNQFAALTTAGTLRVIDGTVRAQAINLGVSSANNIIATSNATLVVSNNIGSPTKGVTTFTATNSTLRLFVTGITNLICTNLVSGGSTNSIVLESVSVFASYPKQVTLIKYTAQSGFGVTNYGLVSVPASAPGAYLSNNIANSSLDLVLPFDPRPIITAQPSSYSGNPGDNVAFTATISGTSATPLTYQWYLGTTPLADGTTGNGSTISGASTASLSINNAQPSDNGNYSVVISNAYGAATNSPAAALTISAGCVSPSLTGPNNTTVIQGNNATLSASASGNPVPDLQWRRNGTDITGQTGSSYTVTNAQYPADDGAVFSLVASNACGMVTNSATLTVIVPPTISGQPVSLMVTSTQPASFSVMASGVPTPTYQWYFNNSPISNQTNATLNLASATSANIGAYKVTVNNAAGSVTSSNASLLVNSTMSATAFSPANGVTGICYDTPLAITFDSAPSLGAAGTIKIYNVTNSATPVDTINVALGAVQQRTFPGDGQSFSYQTIQINGNTAKIYPHFSVLNSNQTYYVKIDNGAFTDATGAYFVGITATNVWSFSTKVGGPVDPANPVVNLDGSGDFLTVQGAVNSIPAGTSGSQRVINIRNGIYTEIVDIAGKHNVTFRGQSRTGAVVVFPNNANFQTANNGTTHARMTFKVNANDVVLDTLTVSNSTPQGGSQAEALMIESSAKRCIVYNSELDGRQDTILANVNSSQAYFYKTLVKGNFDYIWGGGNLYFDQCTIQTIAGASGFNLTAARTDTSATTSTNFPWANPGGTFTANGMSFVNCTFTADSGVGTVTLAGGNGTAGNNVSWYGCDFATNYVAPSVLFSGNFVFWQAAVTSNTVPFTYANVVSLGGTDARLLAATNIPMWFYGWSPLLAPNILTNPISQTVNYASPATFTVAATGIPAPTYQWQHAGTNLPSATGASLTIASATSGDAGSYAVIVTTSAGSATSSTATLTVNPPPNTAPTFNGPITSTNITINVGVSLAVSCAAMDSDSPAQTLTYALLAGPADSALDSYTGNLTWRPTVVDAGQTYNVIVKVTDDGTPNLSATNNFTVKVNSVASPTTSSTSYSGGVFSVSISGQVGPDYALQATTNLVGGTWTTVATTNSPATMPVILTDPNAGSQPMQFYRIVTGPPLP